MAKATKIGTKVNNYLKLLKKISKINAEAAKKTKPLNEKITALEDELLPLMKQENVEKFTSALGTVTRSEIDIASAKDWPKIYDFIYKKKAFHLLNKAIKQASYREYLDDGVKVPGIEIFTKVSLKHSMKKG